MIYERNTLHVCIDEAQNGSVAGRAYMTTRQEPIVFADFAEFILKADRQFDQQGFPQSWQDKRSFVPAAQPDNHYCAKPPEVQPSERFEMQRGRLNTFLVQVQMRRNATWQGSVFRVNGVPVAPFQSELQLLELLKMIQAVSF